MKLLLVDGHSMLNRAFFGIPHLTNSKGVPTNAVYGFLNILFKILEEEQPDFLTVAFDVSAPTFRHNMYEAYKGTRKPMDPDLKVQVPMMKQMLKAMGICVVEMSGYEADDVLGTLAKQGEQQGMEVTIVSGDRDLLQLATEHIKISIPKTKKTGTEIEEYYAKEVKERYAVTPTQFIDVKALMGDTSDNIPGVPGIGEKTATNLIAQYESIENAYAHVEELKPPRAAKNLAEFYQQAQMSKVLATIDTNVPIQLEKEQGLIGDFYTPEAYELCKEWDFRHLLHRFEKIEQKNEEIEKEFVVLQEFAAVEELWNQKLAVAEQLSFAFCEVGVSIAFEEKSYFIAYQGLITKEYIGDKLQKLCQENQRISCYDVKEMLEEFSITLPVQEEKFFDVKIAAYLCNPVQNQYEITDYMNEFYGQRIKSKEERFGKEKISQVWEENQQEVIQYLCYESYMLNQLVAPFLKRLEEEAMLELYQQMELPLVFVLYDMQQAGIALDEKKLKEYSDFLQGELKQLEESIYQQAGEVFNINSPKQLGVILFEKMGLQGGKKTKTGYSTSAEVLEKLAPEVPVVADILQYRQLAKLKSTYADGLLHEVKEDGRIHSTFQQTVTATGRISSTEPNLQNIPIRMELGKKIREVFYAKDGYVFVDADYSQIELRVLAHMSKDKNLLEAYQQNQDIHRSTASKVFHVPFEEVTELQRRNAKAVNFGIVYGISAFGLSRDLSIGRKEAQEYIDEYFTVYPTMKKFLDELVEKGKEQGAVFTMYGRKRPVPELSASNFVQRSFGERIAMNSPIQGSAADIIKLAMIRVSKRLRQENAKSRLLLQVHDELLLEVEQSELHYVSGLLVEEMESAAELLIPLEVDVHWGKNWYQAK